MSEPTNKGGRPRKYPVGPRTNLTVRLPTSLRNRLYDAAQADGRSLAEMIERACEAHLAGSDIRALIREEIRAALAEHEAAKRERLMRAVTVGPNGAYGAGNSANNDLSLYGLNGTRNS